MTQGCIACLVKDRMKTNSHLISKGLLNSSTIKAIALAFMTLDHIGAYAFEFPVVAENYSIFRILGRIAAPLFLFMITESARFTHSKAKLLLRLYVSAVLFDILQVIMNTCWGNVLGIYSHGNILFTYSFVVTYIILIEKLISAIKEKHICKALIFVATLSLTVLLHPLWKYIHSITIPNRFIKEILESFFESPLLVEYSPFFVLLGVLLYFAKNKWLQIGIFLMFCVLCYDANLTELSLSTPFSDFWGYPQYWMVLAAPIMTLYNGHRGKENKMLFYAYYPIHIYTIIIVSKLIG